MKDKSSRDFLGRGSYLHHVVPVVVWLVAVASVAVLFYQRSKRFEVIGIARGQIRQVAASCTGRIKSLPVELFQSVKAGQVVAVLDTVLDDERLQAELAAISAKVEHLMAQLIPTEETITAEATNLETDHIADQRRFAVDVENARLRILGLRATIASDRIRLEDDASEVQIVNDLITQNAAAPYEMQKAKALYDSLAQKIQENEVSLEQAQKDLEQAEARLAQFIQRRLLHPSVDSACEVIRKEAQVQEKLMEHILAKLKPVELKAPIDGVVIPVALRTNEAPLRRPGERVLRREGEVVTAGEAIIAIAAAEPTEIIAYVPQVQLEQIRENASIQLVKINDPLQIATSKVACVCPTIEQMPEQLWRNPNIPQWGRPILIRIPAGFKVLAGEMVGVRGL
jgi:multidrug resistance efflux pump